MAAPIVTIRLNEQTLAALTAAAKAARKTRSTFAADLVQAGLSGPSPGRTDSGESPLVAHVEALFARLALDGADVDAAREMALALARVAEAGGAPVAGAVRELRSILAELDGLLDDDAFGDDLSIATLPTEGTHHD